jgi:hypothetical protein
VRPIEFATSQQSRNIRRHDELRVGERVHQENFVAGRERHTHVEERRLHAVSRLGPQNQAVWDFLREQFLVAKRPSRRDRVRLQRVFHRTRTAGIRVLIEEIGFQATLFPEPCTCLPTGCGQHIVSSSEWVGFTRTVSLDVSSSCARWTRPCLERSVSCSVQRRAGSATRRVDAWLSDAPPVCPSCTSTYLEEFQGIRQWP